MLRYDNSCAHQLYSWDLGNSLAITKCKCLKEIIYLENILLNFIIYKDLPKNQEVTSKHCKILCKKLFSLKNLSKTKLKKKMRKNERDTVSLKSMFAVGTGH